jgi:hypothetical protein
MLLYFYAFIVLKPNAFIALQMRIFVSVHQDILPFRMLSCKGIQQNGQL